MGTLFVSVQVLRSLAPRTEYETPLIPKIHPESPQETKIRKNYEKYTKVEGFRIFSYFFHVRVSGGDSGCILGCNSILGIRGVLYSVRGTGDRNPSINRLNIKSYLGHLDPNTEANLNQEHATKVQVSNKYCESGCPEKNGQRAKAENGKKIGGNKKTDLFSRRFREGISFPEFVERSILKLTVSELCAVPLALQNRALFEGEKRAKR